MSTGRPSRVLLLRHAEKPSENGDPHLSARGRTRAAALSVLVPHAFGRPDHLFATAPSPDSVRPIETLSPLSAALSLPLQSKWSDDDFAALASEILSGKYASANVVVCWHHGKLPKLTHALGVDPKPDDWDAEIFDRFWSISYDKGGTASLTQLAQKLLFGDSRDG
jgi:hypothetical protein